MRSIKPQFERLKASKVPCRRAPKHAAPGADETDTATEAPADDRFSDPVQSPLSSEKPPRSRGRRRVKRQQRA